MKVASGFGRLPALIDSHGFVSCNFHSKWPGNNVQFLSFNTEIANYFDLEYILNQCFSS